MSQKVIELFNSDGTVSRYQPLSERLPAFLEQYGPVKGYAVLIEVQDTLALRPGLLRLYEAAIQAGRKPEEVGLPPLAKEPTLHFQARLLDAEGRVVATAAAVKPILAYKDFEGGETAARQRLVAALGFGGDILDEDENKDRRAMGIPTLESPPAAPPEHGAGATPAVPPPPLASAPVEPAAPVAPAAPAPPASDGQAAQTTGAAPPAAIVAQIQHLATLKGLPVPAYATAAEAKKVLKQLLQA